MRYSILYFIFTFLGLNILVYGGYNQQQVQDTYTQQQPYQQQQTDPYNNLGGPYNDLSSLSNQIIQNGNTINNEQTQNLQQAPNVTQQVWDPSQDQRQFDRSYLQSPYGAPMHAYGPPMYQQGPGPLGPGWKLPPDPKNNPHLPKPPNDSDESKVKNKDSNPNDYNDLTKEVNEWKNKQKDWQQTTMKWALGLGLGTGIPAILLILVCAFCLIRRYRRRKQQHIEGNYNARSPIITNTTKYMNSYTGSWEVPPIVHDDLWAMERDNVVIDYEKKLGAGAFCNVYQGRIIGDAPIKKVYHNLIAVNHFTNCDVAIKILPSFADDIARSDFNQEINFMKSLNYHPHLVSMLGYVADARSPLLIVEYCSQGDLLHLIRERKYEIANGYENQSGLKIKDLVSFSWQISNGLVNHFISS
uniref:Protein kinase domain-containing protein n=1 Tax=Acrobeloides nanus TaxID=290746 RepID=A0A914DMY0_9BILA